MFEVITQREDLDRIREVGNIVFESVAKRNGNEVRREVFYRLVEAGAKS